MARMLRPADTIPSARACFPKPAREQPGSSVRLRLAPTGEPRSFTAWAQESLSDDSTAPVSEEVRKLEHQLVAALGARNGPQAMLVASTMVYRWPEHAAARRIKDRCAKHLRDTTIVFPRPDAIPRMRVAWHELAGRNLSRLAAYMLSCIDGSLRVEQVVDISAMSPLIAYETLDALAQEGIIELI
jgi:hypothetical protein